MSSPCHTEALLNRLTQGLLLFFFFLDYLILEENVPVFDFTIY